MPVQHKRKADEITADPNGDPKPDTDTDNVAKPIELTWQHLCLHYGHTGACFLVSRGDAVFKKFVPDPLNGGASQGLYSVRISCGHYVNVDK